MKLSRYTKNLQGTTPDPRMISAVYDPDTQTYHVFFPRPGGTQTKRLSMNFRSGYEMVNFNWATHSCRVAVHFLVVV